MIENRFLHILDQNRTTKFDSHKEPKLTTQSQTTSSSAIHHTWLKLPPLLPHHLVMRQWFLLRRKSEHVCPSGKKQNPVQSLSQRGAENFVQLSESMPPCASKSSCYTKNTTNLFSLSMLVDVFRMLLCLNPANIFALFDEMAHYAHTLGNTYTLSMLEKLFLFYIYFSAWTRQSIFSGRLFFFWVDESSQTATCHDFPVHLSRISLLLCCSFSPNICFSCCADEATRDYLVSASNRKDKYHQLESITQCQTCQKVLLSTIFYPRI